MPGMLDISIGINEQLLRSSDTVATQIANLVENSTMSYQLLVERSIIETGTPDADDYEFYNVVPDKRDTQRTYMESVKGMISFPGRPSFSKTKTDNVVFAEDPLFGSLGLRGYFLPKDNIKENDIVLWRFKHPDGRVEEVKFEIVSCEYWGSVSPILIVARLAPKRD